MFPRRRTALAVERAADAFDRLAEVAAEPPAAERDADGQPGPELCAIHGAAHAAPAPRSSLPNGATTKDRAWGPAWASDVKQGDLIAVYGDQTGRPDLGLRALLVADTCEEDQTHANVFGQATTVKAVVLLAQDADNDDVMTVSLSPNMGLRIAVKSPDSVPADLEGGAQ